MLFLKLTELEKRYSERSSYLKSVDKELEAVEKEYATSKKELTSKISSLAPQNEQLRVGQVVVIVVVFN